MDNSAFQTGETSINQGGRCVASFFGERMFNISLIPTPYKVLIGMALLLGALAAGAWRGSSATEQRWQLKDASRVATEQAAKLANDAINEKQARQQASKISALDAQYQKDLSDAQTQIDRLRRDVRAGAIRLSVKSKPASSGIAGDPAATSRTNGQAQCELDPTTADDLISITADGDSAIQQLNALQDYVSTLLKGEVP